MILESLNICSHNCGSYEFLGTVHSYLLSLPIPLLGFLFSPFLWISWRALWSLGITPLLVFFFFFLFGDKAKGVHQGCILLPCLFNFYAEYIMWNARLDESQAGIKIARRNMNTLRYAHDTILKAESKEELKSLLMKVKEENEKLALKLSVRRTKIKASGPITS